jgi:hypothetical protein
VAAPSPTRAQQSYRHEAFLWHDANDFTRTMVPFLEEGLAAGEPTMVAVVPEHIGWLRDAMGASAKRIDFVDMQELGSNPARIIPAWQRFLDDHAGKHKPVRGIGEPIWPGRRPEELVECQLHEALLNVAVDPELPFWLVCPYDAEQLSADVVDEAYRSHPVIVEADGYHGSAAYAGRAHVDSLFEAGLSDSVGSVQSVTYTRSDVRRLRGYLRLELHVAGLAADAVEDLTDVVLRLVVSSLHRGSEDGTVKVWSSRDAVVCEVADGSRTHDLLAGRRAPSEEDHDALWLANQTCDLVQLRSTLTGTAVRLHTWK